MVGRKPVVRDAVVKYLLVNGKSSSVIIASELKKSLSNINAILNKGKGVLFTSLGGDLWELIIPVDNVRIEITETNNKSASGEFEDDE
jgi:hypothetical protein